jgi:hypothetical protein
VFATKPPAKPAVAEAGPPAVTTKAFWPLMDRWGVDDELALRLLGHPGGLTSSGKRPRFTLTAQEVSRLGYLQEIGHRLETMFGDAGAWLRQRTSALPFNGLTPLEYMARRGSGGVAEVMRFLARFGLVSSLRT